MKIDNEVSKMYIYKYLYLELIKVQDQPALSCFLKQGLFAGDQLGYVWNMIMSAYNLCENVCSYSIWLSTTQTNIGEYNTSGGLIY